MFAFSPMVDRGCHQSQVLFEGALVEANVNNNKATSWSLLRTELRVRTMKPLAHASFVLYFAGAVLLIGAGGIWLEIYSLLLLPNAVDPSASPASGLRTAVITFFPALAGSSCMQLVLAEDQQKYLKTFALVLMVVIGILAIGLTPAAIGTGTAIFVGAIASVVALWTWWIANAKQLDLLDGDLDAPLGKNPDAEPSGDLNGFNA